ncbi:hypothetical protein TNCV_2091571 [Trichonephila clavipes]|nr:hypothetical protein TNCV_2091571 [Trichonephila clavipes]
MSNPISRPEFIVQALVDILWLQVLLQGRYKGRNISEAKRFDEHLFLIVDDLFTKYRQITKFGDKNRCVHEDPATQGQKRLRSVVGGVVRYPTRDTSGLRMFANLHHNLCEYGSLRDLSCEESSSFIVTSTALGRQDDEEATLEAYVQSVRQACRGRLKHAVEWLSSHVAAPRSTEVQAACRRATSICVVTMF